jgi:hypothetical protein
MEIERNRGMIGNEHIRIDSKSHKNWNPLRLGSLWANQNYIQDKFKAGNSYYYSVQRLLSSLIHSNNFKV